MRVLTVRHPWAWAIIHAQKDVENRNRNIAGGYRGPIAIHAAVNLGTIQEYADAVRTIRDITGLHVPLPGHQTTGAIIGVVDLVGAHHADEPFCIDIDHGPTDEGRYLSCSPWAMDDHYHLELTNPRSLAEPIPYRGGLGLRRITDTEVLELLEALG